MGVKVIRLDKAEELHFRILDLMFPDERRSVHVNYVKLAEQLNKLAKQINPSGKQKHISEEVVRYNVNKLKRLGYIVDTGDYYELTDKLIFANKKSG